MSKVVEKIVNGLIKKHPFLYNYRDELLGEGYIYEVKANKSFDPARGKSLDFWLTLNVASRLKTYIKRKINKHIFLDKHIVDRLSVSFDEGKEVFEFFKNFNKTEKTIFYLLYIKQIKPDTINRNYKIPRKIVNNMANNFEKLISEGCF